MLRAITSIKTVVDGPQFALPRGQVGDKYIEFLFQNNNTPQYLPVQDLVDVYTGDDQYIQVTESNVIKLNYSVLSLKLAADLKKSYDNFTTRRVPERQRQKRPSTSSRRVRSSFSVPSPE